MKRWTFLGHSDRNSPRRKNNVQKEWRTLKHKKRNKNKKALVNIELKILRWMRMPDVLKPATVTVWRHSSDNPRLRIYCPLPLHRWTDRVRSTPLCLCLCLSVCVCVSYHMSSQIWENLTSSTGVKSWLITRHTSSLGPTPTTHEHAEHRYDTVACLSRWSSNCTDETPANKSLDNSRHQS